MAPDLGCRRASRPHGHASVGSATVLELAVTAAVHFCVLNRVPGAFCRRPRGSAPLAQEGGREQLPLYL